MSCLDQVSLVRFLELQGSVGTGFGLQGNLGGSLGRGKEHRAAFSMLGDILLHTGFHSPARTCTLFPKHTSPTHPSTQSQLLIPGEPSLPRTCRLL